MALNILTLFQKLRTGNNQLDLIIEKVYNTLQSITNLPLLSGQLIGPITLASGDNEVPHKLGRPANGYILTRVNAAVTLYDKESTNTMRTQFILINSSGTCIAYFWVF